MGEIVAQGLVASGTGCEGVVRRASEVAEVLALLQAPDLEETILLTESATATTIVPLLGSVRGLICTSGGVTSHVAILSREFGLACVMGAELDDLAALDGARVTIDADGTIARADTRPEIHLNLSVPALAAEAAALPAAGVGLLRAEFLALGVGRHPSALLEEAGEAEFVHVFAEGLETVARAFHPRPVTYRTLDLKSNEYRSLEGGDRFEPSEENPMLGLRGVARYLQRPEELRLELRAVRSVLERGLDNVHVCIPFVRTVDELREVKRVLAEEGLAGRPGFELWAMAEVPSTALLAERFAAEVDGLSIGTNDLTQLVLGADRDSPALAARYVAEDDAVLAAVGLIVAGAHAVGIPVCSCGDAPSQSPALVARLVELGVDRISVPPSAFPATVAAVQAALVRA